LTISAPGLVVLLTRAQDSAALDVLEVLAQPLSSGQLPQVEVLFEAADLLAAPPGSRVVLVGPGADAQWLNLHRPVVSARRLTLLLWCTDACVAQLKQGAPDLMDWVSHRVEVSPSLPRFLTAALADCERYGSVLALVGAPAPPQPWIALAAGAPYRELREACGRGPVWVTGVQDAHFWLSAALAKEQASSGHGLVLADPRVVPEALRVLDARSVPWEEAAATLRGRGIAQPGVAAARLDLDPSALGRPPPEPIRLAQDPRWDAVIAAAAAGPRADDITLVRELELVDVAETWTQEAAPGGRPTALLASARAALQAGEPARAAELAEQSAAEAAAAGDEVGWAQSRSIEADVRSLRGDVDGALRVLRDEVLPVFERLGDVHARAVTLGRIADIHLARGQLDEALRILREELLPVFERLGDVHARAVTLGRIADVHMARGQLDEALRIRTEEELPVFERLGDVRARAVTLGQIADIHMARGQLDEALHIRTEEELPVYERLGDVRARAVTLGQVADIHMARGQLDEALRIRTEEELPVYARLGDVRSRAITLGQIADIHMARGQLDEALRIHTEEQLPVYERLGDVRARAVNLGQIADIHMVRGQLDEALRIHTEEELPVFERLGDVRARAVTLGKVADIHLARGQLDEALRIHTEEQLPVYERLGDVRARAVTLGSVAEIHMARGQLDEALRILREELLPVFERLGDVRSRAVTLGKVADIHLARRQLGEALRILTDEVLPVFERLGDVRARAITLGRIADIQLAHGQLDEAIRIRTEEEIPVYKKLGDVRALLAANANVGVALISRGRAGDRAHALQLLHLAHDAAVQHGYDPERRQIEQILAQLAESRGAGGS
jgi:tetratricopeptide (TPR) repeat protein